MQEIEIGRPKLKINQASITSRNKGPITSMSPTTGPHKPDEKAPSPPLCLITIRFQQHSMLIQSHHNGPNLTRPDLQYGHKDRYPGENIVIRLEIYTRGCQICGSRLTCYNP